MRVLSKYSVILLLAGFQYSNAQPITIITHPASVSITEGNTATFTVEATGISLEYQWKRGTDNIIGATSASYTTPPATLDDNGTVYSCIVSNTSGSVESDGAILTVTQDFLTIEKHPENTSVIEGESALFSVVASGSGLSYQWQKKLYQNEFEDIEGAVGSSYTTPATTLADNMSEYLCKVSNAKETVVSNSAQLSVLPEKPVIVAHPQDMEVDEGETASFSVSATSSVALTYQWRRNGLEVLNSNSDTYTFKTDISHDGNTIDVIVSNLGGDTVSNPAILTVNQLPPNIINHPRDIVVSEDETATFTINVNGSGLSYQWLKNDIVIEGATNSSYTTPPVKKLDNGSEFKCVVRNDVGEYTSNTAALTVTPVICSLDINYDESEGSITLVPDGSNYERGTEVKILPHSHPNYLFEKWTGDTSGTHNPLIIIMDKNKEITAHFKKDIEIDGIRISPNPQWPGKNVTMSIFASSPFDLTYEWLKGGKSHSGEITNSEYVFEVTKSDRGSYYCVVSSDSSTDMSDSILLKVNTPVSISEQPEDLEGWSGKSVTFEVEVDGTGPFEYQWQQRTSGDDWTDVGQEKIYKMSKLELGDDGEYRCIISDEGGNEVTTRTASLEVLESITITRHPKDQEKWLGKTATFQIETKGNTKNIKRQWLHNGKVIRDRAGEELTVEIEALSDAGEYRCKITDGGGSVTTSKPAELKVLEPANIYEQSDTRKTIFLGDDVTFSVKAKGEKPLEYKWFFNGSEIEGETESEITIRNALEENGGNYVCRVSNGGGSDESDKIRLFIDGTARIIEQMKNSTVYTGKDAVLSIVANGSWPIEYEWQFKKKPVQSEEYKGLFNDSALQSSTTDSFVIHSVRMSNEGNYRCIVYNNKGADTSTNVVVTVRKTAKITNHPDTITENKGEDVHFTVRATGYGKIKYQWQKKTDDDWEDMSEEKGSSLYILNIEKDDIGNYRCLAGNEGGTDTSKAAYLNIIGEAYIRTDLKSEYIAWTREDFEFEILVGGSMPIECKWFKKNKDEPVYETSIENSINATFIIKNITRADAGEYYCVVDNYAKEPDTSKFTALTIKKSARITKHPESKNVRQGEKVELYVEADGEPGSGISYSWLKDGFPQVGYQSNPLTINEAAASDRGNYQCIVKNGGAPDTSRVALVEVSGTIKIIKPNGGEIWGVDEIRTIEWNIEDDEDVKFVKIEFSSDGGHTWTPIVEKYQNLEKYDWKVRQLNSNFCKIRITHSDPDLIYVRDESDRFFTIDSDIPIINYRKGKKIFLGDQVHIYPNPVNKTGDKVMNFSLGTSLKIIYTEISIYDALGNFIIGIPKYNLTQNNGNYHLGSWNLLTQTGRQIYSGSYLAVFTITDREGQKYRLTKLIGVNQ